MSADPKDPFIVAYRKLLSVSKTLCRKEFTCSGDTYGEVFSMAAGLKKTLSGRGAEKSVCLCTENKAVVTASILASLSGACNLILPHSFSAHALLETYEATGFDAAIADRPEEMPGVEMITPTAGDTADLNPGTNIILALTNRTTQFILTSLQF